MFLLGCQLVHRVAHGFDLEPCDFRVENIYDVVEGSVSPNAEIEKGAAVSYGKAAITLFSVLLVALGVLAQNSLLRASPPIGSVVSQDESKTKLDHEKLQKPSKHSATPLQDTQIELVPDQDRRQLRESRYKRANAEIKDPADKTHRLI